MKTVYVKPPPAAHYLNNGVFRVNNGHNIFWNIDKQLVRHGVVVKTLDMDKEGDGDLYVYSDAPYPWGIELWKRTVSTKGKNILFCFESPIVNPFSHLRVVHSFFQKVYTWDDGLIDNRKYFKFFIPQLSHGLNSKPVDFKKRKFLTFINAKKDMPPGFRFLSPYKKNLYKERIRAVKYFSEQIPLEFDFYGRGWDEPISWNIGEKVFGVQKSSSYKGVIRDDKLGVLSKYKFCICFENAVAPGYITEKIFDCFKARCVPVYWGAPDVDKYVPTDCFIDFREFNDYEKLLYHLRTVTEKKYDLYMSAIAKFLLSRNTRARWFNSAFKKTVIRELR